MRRKCRKFDQQLIFYLGASEGLLITGVIKELLLICRVVFAKQKIGSKV